MTELREFGALINEEISNQFHFKNIDDNKGTMSNESKRLSSPSNIRRIKITVSEKGTDVAISEWKKSDKDAGTKVFRIADKGKDLVFSGDRDTDFFVIRILDKRYSFKNVEKIEVYYGISGVNLPWTKVIDEEYLKDAYNMLTDVIVYDVNSDSEFVLFHKDSAEATEFIINPNYYEFDSQLFDIRESFYKKESDNKAKESAEMKEKVDNLFNREADEEKERLEKEAKEKEESQKKEESAKDKIERYKKYFYESMIKMAIEEVIEAFDSVYGPGFTGLGSVGLLISEGSIGKLVEIRSKDSYSASFVDDGWVIADNQMMSGIEETIGKLKVTDKFELGQRNLYMLAYQTYFMTANIKLAKGLCSIRTYVREKYNKDIDEWCKEENGSTVKIRKYDEIKKWWAYCIEKIIYSELIQNNIEGKISTSDTEGDEARVSQIVECVTGNLKNVICVAERNIGTNYKVRVSTCGMINCDSLIASIERKVNSAGTSRVSVKTNIYGNSKFTSFNAIYDNAKYSKSDKFAYEVAFDEEGNIRNGFSLDWGHALLGKKDDDNYFFWDDFKGEEKLSKRVYAIYAESGAGKGVMTSSLLANAVIGGEKIFYLDGKPENGPTLGQVAWNKGREAFVFNGLEDGTNPFSESMEAYTNGKRTESEVRSFCAKLPEKLFNNEAFTMKYLAFMRYMRGFEIMTLFIDERSKNSYSDWQIWVLDEMTKMSRVEKDIRKTFASFMAGKDEIAKSVVKDGCLIRIKENSKLSSVVDVDGEKYNPDIAYIYNWLKWIDTVTQRFLTGVTANIRKARLNIIYIFQNACWLNEDDGITAIREIVAKTQCTKVIGFGGIARNCGEYGDGTVNAAWLTKLQNEKGLWAITNTSDLRKDQNPTLFKPYKVWTVPFPGSKSDPRCYFENYVNKYCEQIGVDAAASIEQAWIDAETLVVSKGYADSLKQFMYDVSNLTPKYTNFSLEELQNRGDSTNNVVNSVLTSDVDESDSDEFDGYEKEDLSDFFGADDEEDVDYGYRVNKDNHVDADSGEEVIVNEKTIENLEFMRTDKLQFTLNKCNDAKFLAKVYYNKTLSGLLKNIEDFNIYNMYRGDNNGLYGLTLLASNLHMLEHEMLINENMKYSFNKNCEAGRIVLKLFGMYDKGLAEYDTIPRELTELKEEAVIIKEGQNIEIEDDRYKGPNFVPMQDVSINRERDFSFKKKIKDTIEIPETSRIRKTITRINASAYEKKNYIAYDFRNIWNMILDDICSRYKSAQIRTLAIIGARVEVNGKMYRYDEVLGGKYDIRFRDIFKIEETLKRFKNLQALTIEADLVINAKRQLRADNVEETFNKIFARNKNLEVVEVIRIERNGEERIVGKVQRENINDFKKDCIRREEIQNKVENIAANRAKDIKTNKRELRASNANHYYSNKFFERAVNAKTIIGTGGWALVGAIVKLTRH